MPGTAWCALALGAPLEVHPVADGLYPATCLLLVHRQGFLPQEALGHLARCRGVVRLVLLRGDYHYVVHVDACIALDLTSNLPLQGQGNWVEVRRRARPPKEPAHVYYHLVPRDLCAEERHVSSVDVDQRVRAGYVELDEHEVFPLYPLPLSEVQYHAHERFDRRVGNDPPLPVRSPVGVEHDGETLVHEVHLQQPLQAGAALRNLGRCCGHLLLSGPDGSKSSGNSSRTRMPSSASAMTLS
eukprot:CAMPEP_0173322134 /NCGR_PEP_ID=MMETSP1143-20121109/29800_1 /TAXON_ID=483371 /ORGANISM="non described non described, Strain CCMP2298" /LENGTH=241 /DNA_ID=CAMNT_0014265969 /DNA_START=83 /DNA_END=809 /DNA_ORIENTATION=+